MPSSSMVMIKNMKIKFDGLFKFSTKINSVIIITSVVSESDHCMQVFLHVIGVAYSSNELLLYIAAHSESHLMSSR